MQSQFAKALSQIQDKGPIPELDFTQHQLDDGNVGSCLFRPVSHCNNSECSYTPVSTQERIVKDVRIHC
jgi:hypothetical protein